MSKPRRLGVLLFPGFEVLDAYGFLEMFSFLTDDWETVAVAENRGPVASRLGIETMAAYGFDDCPHLDCLIVPGGPGTRKEVSNRTLVNWLAERAAKLTFLCSVCTGAGLLAAAGILDGRKATSNKLAWEWVVSQGPNVTWIKHARWVVDDNIWTSAGVSAGMDMALAFIKEQHGPHVAADCAKKAEYSGLFDDPSNDPFGKE